MATGAVSAALGAARHGGQMQHSTEMTNIGNVGNPALFIDQSTLLADTAGGTINSLAPPVGNLQ